MHLHVEGSRQDLIAELTLPEFLVLNHMGITVAVGEVDVEVFYGFGDLLLNASLFLFDFDNATMGCPVALYALQGLLEEKGKIHCLLTRNSKALEVDMTVVFGELLEKHSVQIVFIEGPDKALFVVAELCLDVFIKPDACLFMVDRG